MRSAASPRCSSRGERCYAPVVTEVGRLLRYAVPGAVFELVLGSWLFADAWGCECAVGAWVLSRVEVADPSTALLLVAGAFPLGFLISVIANEIAWLLIRLYPETRVRGRIATSRVVALVERGGPHRQWLRATRAEMDFVSEKRSNQREADEATVELVQRMAGRGEAYGGMVDRVRSLADVMNSLLNTGAAVALAALACGIVYGLTMRFDQNAADDWFWLGWFAVGALVLVAGVLTLGITNRCVQKRAIEAGSATLLAWSVLCMGFVVLDRSAAQDSWRLFTYLAFQGIALSLLLCLAAAERRVASITEVFVVGMIRWGWQSRD